MVRIKKVNNFKEYLEKLKKRFMFQETMPDSKDILDFIRFNNLSWDWSITLSDVKQDINTYILSPKSNHDHIVKLRNTYRNRMSSPFHKVLVSNNSKSIHSYKEYLEKLKYTFGIPESMPHSDEIHQFIEEYKLNLNYGITIEDVSKDLQAFINGKYERMIKESDTIRRTKTVCKPVAVFHPFQSKYPIPTYYSLNLPIDISETKIRSNQHTQKINKSTSKKTNNKTYSASKEYYLIDGDNNLPEGKKGLENLSKDKTVKVYFCQKNAKIKFDKKYEKRPNVSSEYVKPGDQAVDNRIKRDAGRLLKDEHNSVKIISHDKGFTKYRDRKKNENSSNHIEVAKSIRESRKNNS